MIEVEDVPSRAPARRRTPAFEQETLDGATPARCTAAPPMGADVRERWRMGPEARSLVIVSAVITAFGLAVLILMLGPVSGAHFTPVVTLADPEARLGAGDIVSLRLNKPLLFDAAGGRVAA